MVIGKSWFINNDIGEVMTQPLILRTEKKPDTMCIIHGITNSSSSINNLTLVAIFPKFIPSMTEERSKKEYRLI